ncbi:DUF7537 family lipoprotein [Halosimplex halobium]|uniref:DUF7537 family lipoprotein n=1 Tax=Halosimplex halobium TaxID=3396618 RepID=UPI003F575CB9
MDRKLLTVAVAALVVLSGCSIIGGGGSTATPGEPSGEPTATETTAGTGTATPTAAATPWPTATAAGTTAPTATPTPASTATPESTPAGDLDPVSSMSSLPPGVEGGQVANVTALAAANREGLTAGGVDLRMTIANSSREGTGAIRIANDTESSHVRLTEAAGAAATTDISTYYGPEAAGIYNRSSGEIAYGHGPTSTRFGAQLVTGIAYIVPQAYVSAPDWEAAGSTTADGERRLVLTADSLRDDSQRAQPGGGVAGAGEEVTAVDARAEVTSGGLVRALNVTLTIEQAGGEPYTQAVSYTVADLEAGALDRPAWLSKPPQVTAATAADNRLLVVEHTGGPTIEPGTNLTVGGQFTSLGNVSADQPISEGDTLYVYATGEGFDRTPRLSVNERPELPENATAFSGQIGVTGRQGDLQFGAAVAIDGESTAGAA